MVFSLAMVAPVSLYTILVIYLEERLRLPQSMQKSSKLEDYLIIMG
jgi:hypothetical protein